MTPSSTLSEPAATAVRDLGRRLGADQVLVPGPAYERALPLWNGAVRARPAVFAQCRSASDVQAAVGAARASGLPLSVRGAGSDWAGRALRDGGLVVDLRRMRRVAVEGEVAVAEGGATSADVAGAAQSHGLTPVVGAVGSVGMAGLTLGGGYGPLVGRAGLAADNLLGAEVVLPDGRLVTTDADHEPELFWALRGGGGNFGVVTAVRVRLHPVAAVLTGVVAFGWDQAPRVLEGAADLVTRAPDDLTLQLLVLPGPDGAPTVCVTPTWSGDPDRGARAVDAVAALGDPVVVQVGPASVPAMLAASDPFVVGGRHYAIRTTTLAVLGPEAVTALVAAGGARSSALSMVSIKQFHGAATRVPETSTPFGLREPHLVVEVIAAWEGGGADGPDDGADHRSWADDLATALAPHGLPGGYPALLAADRHEQIAHAYGPNASRLAAAKKRFDPDGALTATPLPPPPATSG